MGKSSEPRIFVTVGERTLQQIEQMVSSFNSSLGLELRLDYLENTQNLDKNLRELLSRLRFPRFVATCRRAAGGANLRERSTSSSPCWKPRYAPAANWWTSRWNPLKIRMK